MTGRWISTSGVLIAGALCVVAVSAPLSREANTPAFPTPRHDVSIDLADGEAHEALRRTALDRARVWQPADPSRVDFGRNPPDPTGALSHELVRCRFVAQAAEGTTPKFRCVLPDGEVVKVKYGPRTGEVHAELAASRLLSALGFAADEMFLVPRVRCFGCPRYPFLAMWALERLNVREPLVRRLPEDHYQDFEWVAVERRYPAAELTVGGREGWAWYELAKEQAAQGSSKAEADALRLMAALIVHWDNKSTNQRLACLPPVEEGDAACERPIAYIQDLGATFGPNKMDLKHWRETPIWADAARCIVSMRDLPYGGGTFTDVAISDAGRQLLARQLRALGDDQLTALFTWARFREFGRVRNRDGEIEDWVRVFKDKVSAIADRAACPPQPATAG